MKIAHNYYVYIIECSDKSYYTGVTNNLERRIWEHNNDNAVCSYTSKEGPYILNISNASRILPGPLHGKANQRLVKKKEGSIVCRKLGRN